MLQIIYASSATPPMNAEQLKVLLAVSKRNNEAVGVTGLLLYKDGNFLQLLEGPKGSVTQVFDRVRQDPRHERIIVLLQESSSAREFAGWTMGFHNLDCEDGSTIPGFVELDSLSLNPSDLAQHPSRALRLLSLFATAS